MLMLKEECISWLRHVISSLRLLTRARVVEATTIVVGMTATTSSLSVVLIARHRAKLSLSMSKSAVSSIRTSLIHLFEFAFNSFEIITESSLPSLLLPALVPVTVVDASTFIRLSRLSTITVVTALITTVPVICKLVELLILRGLLLLLLLLLLCIHTLLGLIYSLILQRSLRLVNQPSGRLLLLLRLVLLRSCRGHRIVLILLLGATRRTTSLAVLVPSEATSTRKVIATASSEINHTTLTRLSLRSILLRHVRARHRVISSLVTELRFLPVLILTSAILVGSVRTTATSSSCEVL